MTAAAPSLLHLVTILTYCSLYGAQPIQPLLAGEFHLSHLQAILFTTLIIAPLGIAPLLYGYLLESHSVKVMLRLALALLGVLELLFALADSYVVLLVLRGLQGLMIPAILTSIVTSISYSSSRERVGRNIAVYIAATIVGGFLGRFLCGVCTDLFGWRVFFFALGVMLLISCLLLRTMPRDVKLHSQQPRLSDISHQLGQPPFLRIYLAIFCLFFVFVGIMNFLPFELKRLDAAFREGGIGLLYLGYGMGIVVSLNARRIVQWCGGEKPAITMGIAIFAVGTTCFLAEHYLLKFAAMFVFCAGMFIAHSLLSGLVNTLSRDNKGIANGLYMCFYYTGGTLGSFLPGAIYHRLGWAAFLGQMLLMIAMAFLLLRRLEARGSS
jgi:MFS transporter, YNFM family, putative membrane transport protein